MTTEESSDGVGSAIARFKSRVVETVMWWRLEIALLVFYDTICITFQFGAGNLGGRHMNQNEDPNAKTGRRVAELPVFVTKRHRSKRRVAVMNKHLATPSDIKWTAIESELTDVVDLHNDGEVGHIKIRGLHAEQTEIVGINIPDEVLTKGGYIDLPVIRKVGGLLP